MNEVKIDGYKILFPSSAEELTERDIYFLGNKYPFLPTYQFYTELFAHFCNLRLRWRFKLRLIKRVTAEDITCILTNNFAEDKKTWLLDWLFHSPQMEKIVMSFLYVNKKKYFAADIDMLNMRMGDFKWAEKVLQGCLQGEKKHLAILAASVYRETPNEDFSERKLDMRGEIFTQLPLKSLKAIFFQYMLNRNFIITQNANVFKGDQPKQDYDWGDAIYDMAGSIEKVNDIENMHLRSVLSFLDHNIKHPKNRP